MRFDERTIVELLEGALHRLEGHGWTTGFQARTCEGQPVAPESEDAASFCMYGALRAEALSRNLDRARALLLAEDAARYLGSVMKRLGQPIFKSSAPRTLMEWNDAPGRSQHEVLDVYRHTLLAMRPR